MWFANLHSLKKKIYPTIQCSQQLGKLSSPGQHTIQPIFKFSSLVLIKQGKKKKKKELGRCYAVKVK